MTVESLQKEVLLAKRPSVEKTCPKCHHPMIDRSTAAHLLLYCGNYFCGYTIFTKKGE